MKIKKTFIEGLLEIEYDIFEDVRGLFIKPFNSESYSHNDLSKPWKEIFFSQSKKNVIRGMHVQVGNSPCDRLVFVVNGEITDVVLDLKKSSPTYGQYYSRKLSLNSGIALYIPSSCAHGFRADTEEAVVMYVATELHDAAEDTGVLWDSFGYDWGSEDFIISDRDRKFKKFNNI